MVEKKIKQIEEKKCEPENGRKTLLIGALIICLLGALFVTIFSLM